MFSIQDYAQDQHAINFFCQQLFLRCPNKDNNLLQLYTLAINMHIYSARRTI